MERQNESRKQSRDFDHNEALIKASFEKDVKEVETLLKNPDININYFSKKYYCTAIYAASIKGRTEIVKLFLREEKIDINYGNTNKYTPLSTASFNGHI
jgi:ankyrin repeat protein